MTQHESKTPPRRPKLRLPFTDKKGDMGVWAYDHRVGLCAMIIAYLVLAIVFVSAKIFVGTEPHTQGFYIELEELSALEQLRDRLEQQAQQQQEDQFDWSQVSNRTSNENSLDERVTDDRNTNTSALQEEAQRAQEQMEANRKAYEEALAAIEQQREEDREQQQSTSERRDIKREGNVTVSYSFASPVRHAQELVVPAYQCEGGGEVELAVTLNARGEVTTAAVKRGGDNCMQQTALKAARASRFNSDSTVPDPQAGTITYIFIPQ